MTTIRKFHMHDAFKFSNINMDSFTETFNNPYYMRYLARWPDMFVVTEHPGGRLGGYMMGKSEGKKEEWHGHVSAVTVAPEYRRIGLAKLLMDYLEKASEDVYVFPPPPSVKAGLLCFCIVCLLVLLFLFALRLLVSIHCCIVCRNFCPLTFHTMCVCFSVSRNFLTYLSPPYSNAYFVDLFVRASNTVAIDMYKRLGYVVYREVNGYYAGEEDAYDMRKACKRDVNLKSIVPHVPFRIEPQDL